MTILASDSPTLLDDLGHYELAKEIGVCIANCQLPQTFGLHGDWGAGKTSLLHQVHFHLTGECPQHSKAIVDQVKDAKKLKPMVNPERRFVIWFEAWKYQNEQAPIVALLHEIREQLSWMQKAKGSISKLTHTAIKGCLFSIEDLTKKIGVQASKIQSVGETWERENLASKLPADNIRQLLEHAIDGLIGNTERKKNRNRLVILVDDLDRCETDAAYKLLEGLKIYLSLNNTVFLLGMNQRIVEDAIAKNISVDTVPEKRKQVVLKDRALAYMEKICHNIWRMPLINHPADALFSFIQKLHDHNLYSKKLAQAFDNDTKNCLPPNPRRLKAFANLLHRNRERIKKLRTDQIGQLLPNELRKLRILIVTLYIYQFHHDIYRRWCLNPDLFEEIKKWCFQRQPIPTADAELQKAQALQQKEEQMYGLQALFPHIQRTGWHDPRDEEPTPGAPGFTTSFPDPTESTVFWILPMVIKLGISVTSEEFERYLNIS